MFRRKKPIRKIVMVCLAAALICAAVVMNNIISDTVYMMAQFKATEMAVNSMNNAVRMKIAEENISYQDMVKIHKDSTGKIVLVQADTVKINKLASETTLAVQDALSRLNRETLSIPMGQLTGVYFLAGYGPGIEVKIVPVGAVRAEVSDRFEQAGINQTRHYIYLNYSVDMRIVIPLIKKMPVNVSTQVPVAENIIIGEVPATFVSLPGGLFGSGHK